MSAAHIPLYKRLAKHVHALKALACPPHTEILPLLEQYVPMDGIIIDAGAGTGQFIRLFAQAAPQGHVYTFEPHRKACSALSRVIAAKKLQNVSLFPMGLSDKPSEETLAMLTGTSGGGCPVMKGPGAAEKEKIVLTTLDLFASRHNLKRVDFIRSGAGGHELQFLHGAAQTIKNFKPALLLESQGGTAAEMRDFLTPLNYRIENDAAGHIWCVPEERRKSG